MVTHDISEAFKLGTRLIVFDKVRHDPQFPNAFGATITYDLPIQDKTTMAGKQAAVETLVSNHKKDQAS
jgi:NitT/TauT family transport system ATP-binding protein